jgi:hypothetical protein
VPIVGRDSSVSIVIRYGLEGPGIEPRWSRDLPQLSRLVPGVKQTGRSVNHPPTSKAEVKERVELYVYSPSGPLRPVTLHCAYEVVSVRKQNISTF